MFRTSNKCRVCRLRSVRRLSLLTLWGIYIQLFHVEEIGTSQEALQSSLAGQEAVDEKKRAASARQFNVKFDNLNLALELGTQLSVEFNDNIFNNDIVYGLVGDLIFRPQLTVAAVQALTDKNRLTLALGLGYSKYVNNPILDTPLITPGSDLSFDVYVRDFLINFHDRFSLRQDLYARITSATTATYLKRFDNTAGVSVSWDLNKAILTAGYDHYNFIPLTQDYDYLTSQSELFVGSALFEFTPTIQAGPELSGGMLTYDQGTFNNLTHFSGGVVVKLRSSEYLDLRLDTGYVVYSADTGGLTNSSSGNEGVVYARLTLKQSVNRRISYSVSAGRELLPGISLVVNPDTSQTRVYAVLRDRYYVGGRAEWNVIRNGSLGTSFSYEHSNETLPSGQWTSDRYQAGIDISRQFSGKLSTRLAYWHTFRHASLQFNDYTQNRLVFELLYRF